MTNDLIEESLQVPRGLGVEGALALLKKVLLQPGTVRIELTSTGKLTFYRKPTGTAADNIELDLSECSIKHLLLQWPMHEWTALEKDLVTEASPIVTVCTINSLIEQKRFRVIGYVVHSSAKFLSWFYSSLPEDQCSPHTPFLFGVRVYEESQLPEDVLVVAGGIAGDTLEGLRLSYKVLLPGLVRGKPEGKDQFEPPLPYEGVQDDVP